MIEIQEKYKLDKDYYQIGKVSGKISTGYIYEAFQILSPLKKLAMKQVWIENQGRKSLPYILNQLKYLCQFDHVNLLKTYGYYIDGQKICIMMDFYATDLYDLIKEKAQKSKVFTLEEIIKCLYQISDAYSYMVDNFSIAHRDIRPENIFIDSNNNFVLANFEIFKYGDVKGINEYQISGVPSFFSPELYIQLKNQENTCKYSLEKNDIFSLGLVALEMLFNEFQGFRKQKERQSEQFLNDYLQKKENDLFPELLPILKKMIDPNAETRINFKMLSQELYNLQKILEAKSLQGKNQIYEETKINHPTQEFFLLVQICFRSETSKRKQSEADKLKIQQENLYLKSMVENLLKEKEDLEDINLNLQEKFQQLINKRKQSKKVRKDQTLQMTDSQNSQETKE